jgi:cytoskeleton protein RodZ
MTARRRVRATGGSDEQMAEMDQDQGYGGTVGERLRRTREAKGLTLDDVASQTRVPIRHLRNIEDSNWGELPAITYTIGFARSYANAIGMDGAEVGRELREQLGDESRSARISPQYYDPPDPARVPSRSLAWVAGLLLVALVAAWLLVIRPAITRSGDESAAITPPPAEQQAQAPAQPQAPPPQQAPQNLTGQPVVLVASEAVWFQVNDRAAANRRLYAGQLAAGEQYQVPADAQQPVIRTGRPQVLRAVVGGRDLGPLAPTERTVSNVSLLANDLASALQGQGGAAPGQAQPAAPGGNTSLPMR